MSGAGCGGDGRLRQCAALEINAAAADISSNFFISFSSPLDAALRESAGRGNVPVHRSTTANFRLAEQACLAPYRRDIKIFEGIISGSKLRARRKNAIAPTGTAPSSRGCSFNYLP